MESCPSKLSSILANLTLDKHLHVHQAHKFFKWPILNINTSFTRLQPKNFLSLTALNFLSFHISPTPPPPPGAPLFPSPLFYVNFLSCFFEQIGPNVSISANVRVGAGVRLIGCIVLDDVEIKVQNWIYKKTTW